VSEVDDAYLAYRQKILLGQIHPGSAVDPSEFGAEYGFGVKKARQILNSLWLDGYLTKGGRGYAVVLHTADQLDEWREMVLVFAEIGAGRLAVETEGEVARLEEFYEKALKGRTVDDEEFFISAMKFVSMLMGGPTAGLARIMSQLVPQAFYRLMWLADARSGGGEGYLLRAIEAMLAAAKERDVVSARAACRIYSEGVRKELLEQLEKRNAGVQPTDGDRARLNDVLEFRLTGEELQPGRGLGREQLLDPLQSDAQPRSIAWLS